ncbi:GntR family transcriptional regulator [Actinophytocola sp.]|uniref:GntR family transcriptional regulator n=1 Tax=Actinophytocola sp. TaxID=1872138 RepID=UPI003D6B2133
MDSALNGEPWPVPYAAERVWRRLGGTARDRIAQELRDRILIGDLPPGSRIDLDSLAEEFHSSRTPIREACLELAHDGLITVAPRSGIKVIGVTAEDTLENFMLMAVMMGVASGLAAERITPEELEKIQELRNDVVTAARVSGDVVTANWMFHREINRATKSSRLLRLIGQTGRLIPITFLHWFPKQIPCSLSEHDALVDALANRDAAAARLVTEQHFAEPARLLASRMRSERSAPTNVLNLPGSE